MKFASTLLFACVILGLARSEEQIPTEPGTLLEFKKKCVVVSENDTLTVQFGKKDQPVAVRVIPCYGLNAHAATDIQGYQVQEDDFVPPLNQFNAGYTEGPASLTLTSTKPAVEAAKYNGMFEVFTANSFDELSAMCPTITNPTPTFTINMKKKSDDNSAVVSWDPVAEKDGITYTVYRRDIKIDSSEKVIPDGVYDTACGAKTVFTKMDVNIREAKKISCSVTGLQPDVISSIMIVATKDSTGCSLTYSRVNLNDGASSLSCLMAIILFFALYLFI